MANQQWEHVALAARVVADLVTAPEVAERWTEESSCAGMSVGGLAYHLGSQVDVVGRLLTGEPTDDAPIPLVEHYRRATWANTGLDDEVNVSIREGSDADAAGGPEGLAREVQGWVAALGPALSGDLPTIVNIPWQGWSLATEDFLATRFMEMVVHADDLADSVGLPTPEFPDAVLGPALHLLTSVAVDRHGQAAVVRALSRPQRAPSSVSAF